MINGILTVRKEPGYTSHDVVARLRRIVHQKKIGHTGTLDPQAVGVLPVCLGRATKVCQLLTDETKTYEALVLLGQVTDTQDTEGKVLERREVVSTEAEVRETLASFVGEQMQVPPMYSALKVNGRKLYELARRGETVERQARPVFFYEIELVETSLPHFLMRVTCSKGTYIRTLCHDIGEKLGCGACMEHLTRTRVGGFHLEDSYSLDEIEQAVGEGRLDDLLILPDSLFADAEKVVLFGEAERLAKNGNRLELPNEGDRLRLYDSRGHFIGLYKREGKYCLPLQMFWDPDLESEG